MGLPSTPCALAALPSCRAWAFAGAGRWVAYQEKPVSSREGGTAPSHLPDVLASCVCLPQTVCRWILPPACLKKGQQQNSQT